MDLACERCANIQSAGSNKILICDHCQTGWHQLCAKPPLTRLPPREQPWYCEWCVTLQRTWKLDTPPLTVAVSISSADDVRALLEAVFRQ